MPSEPFTLEEDKKILRYILNGQHEKSTQLCSLWEQMESEKVCFPRSWRSMKRRFKNKIKSNIADPTYGLTQKEKLRFTNKSPSKNYRPARAKPIISLKEAPMDIFYRYAVDEDKAILKYILDGKYEGIVKGNELWKKMESANICPKRTWQGLRNRFLKHLSFYCSDPKYELSSDEQKRLKSAFYAKVKKKTRHRSGDSGDDEVSQMEQVKSSQVSVKNSQAHRTSVRTARHKRTASINHTVLSAPRKEFYSLDVEWSDSD